MRKNSAKAVALGGVMAALATVIMGLGGLIPVATYVCPVLCMMLLAFVAKLCGNRIGWAWYGAVSLLGLLLAPDREAAAVFAFLGYYPILKPRMDRMRFGRWAKAALFNGAILLMYWLLIHLFGMDQIARDCQEMGIAMTAVTLLLGNVTFWVLDRALLRFSRIG